MQDKDIYFDWYLFTDEKWGYFEKCLYNGEESSPKFHQLDQIKSITKISTASIRQHSGARSEVLHCSEYLSLQFHFLLYSFYKEISSFANSSN